MSEPETPEPTDDDQEPTPETPSEPDQEETTETATDGKTVVDDPAED